MDAYKAESKGYHGDGYTDCYTQPVDITLSNHMKGGICL